MDGLPKPGELYQHGKDKPYQIITVANHTLTGERFVVYQNLYGDFKTYVIPLSVFQEREGNGNHLESEPLHNPEPIHRDQNIVNHILMDFLDAESFHKKLEILTANLKNMDDRLINDMAVSLDCTIDDGPLDKRIQELIYCLKAMSRFEDRRNR